MLNFGVCGKLMVTELEVATSFLKGNERNYYDSHLLIFYILAKPGAGSAIHYHSDNISMDGWLQPVLIDIVTCLSTFFPSFPSFQLESHDKSIVPWYNMHIV